MKKIIYIIATIFVVLLSSCSNHDYVNAIPGNSTALIKMNAADFASEKTPFGTLLMPFADKDKKQLKGIDLSKDIYMFVTNDGNFGICAPLSDGDEMKVFLSHLKGYRIASAITEKDGVNFISINDSWMVGFDDEAMLIIGPYTGSDAKQKLTKRIGRLLQKDEETGIKNSVLWEHMEENDAPIRMVAQANALPEQFVSSLTLGAPKGTDAADILLEAGLEFKNNTLTMDGCTCSFNENIKQSMQKALDIFSPLTIDYQQVMNDSTVAGIFVNVDGNKFSELLSNNKELNMMLMGTDAFDEIKKNEANMAILFSTNGDIMSKDGIEAKVQSMGNGTYRTDDKLVVVLNLNALQGDAAKIIQPFMGKVKKIVYTIK